MNFKILKLVSADKDEFLEFWSSRYNYPSYELYDNNIDKPLNEERVIELYRRKNGLNLSKAKKALVYRAYISQLGKLPVLNDLDKAREYILNLDGGQIWDIFWLHCLNPKIFPIFDQHTYRAMADIKNLSKHEIPFSRKEKIRIYFDDYIPFVSSLDNDYRYIDKALFKYGETLKSLGDLL